jgi:hypothetical protein
VAGRRRGAAGRWALVAVLVGVLAALPVLIGALPARDAPLTATTLRRAVLASAATPFSGYAESAGGLALPVSEQLTSVADLFSDRTTMRVWWRGSRDNRVDVLTPAGELDVHRNPTGSWTWNYGSNTATEMTAAPLTLPRPADLLPSSLARRLLAEAAPGELTRIGARRIADRDALGLRLRPSQPAASVARVDVWVDRASGLALQVQVVAKGARLPALDSRFLELRLGRPPASVTAFTPPVGATVRPGTDVDDVIAQAESLGGRPPALPAEFAGLPRRALTGVPDDIGVYGRGITLLVVAPVPERFADGLRDALTRAAGAVVEDRSVRTAAGPLALMVVDPPGFGGYLLAGTVTGQALVDVGNSPALAAGWFR